MQYSRFLCYVFVVWWSVQVVQAERENVALRKPVIAVADWKECLTDGRLVNSVISPKPTTYPFYAVDLGAVYNLSEIKLYAQDQWQFGQQGINETFEVHTYGDFASPCALHAMKWDELAKNLRFQKKREEIILKPTKLVQYIIISRENAQVAGFSQSLVMGEVMAFGEKVRDTKPSMPEDDEPSGNYYIETRRAVIGQQANLRVEQEYGAWQPNATLRDVPFGWHHGRINSMAVQRKNGRIIVIQGEQFIPRLLNDQDYQGLRESFKNWLSQGAQDSQFRRINEPYKDKDILIVTRKDSFDVEQIYKRITTSVNPIIIGYVTNGQEDDATRLIQKLEINFYKHDGYYAPRDIPLQDKITSNEYIPLVYQLQRHVDSWTTYRTESFTDRYSWAEWHVEEVQAQLKQIIKKYGRFIESIAPCELQTYWKNQKTEVALRNYNLLLLRQIGDRITPLPGVERNPGTVDPQEKPTTVTVTVNTDFYGNFYPTGAYAKPDEGFRWKVLNNTRPSFKDMWIRVNAQTDGIAHHDQWNRWPHVYSKRGLSDSGNWAVAHGGPIFLELDRNINVTIQFENVYRHAYVDLRNPESIKSFGSKLKEHKGVPWFIVMGDSMYSMLHMRSTVGRTPQDIISSAEFFDKCIKIMHNYRGTNYKDDRPHVFVNDVQISAGWGHSGYPWMGHLAWSDIFTNWEAIKTGEHWGYIHELGHNLQVGPATLKNGGEVTNNVFILPCTAYLLGSKNDKFNQGFIYGDGWMNSYINERWKQSGYHGPALGYYAHLTALFSEGLVGNIFKKAMANSGRLRSEDEKTQFWVQQVCTETGYDMVPYHQLSKFPMNNQTLSLCQQFPCFMPDDEITKRAPGEVDKVLKAYERNCTRSGQKKVEFDGDIMHGTDKLRPQVVFIH